MKEINWDTVAQEFKTLRAANKEQTQSQVINALAKKYKRSYTTIYQHIRNRKPNRTVATRSVVSRPAHQNGTKQLEQARQVSNAMFADVVALLQSKREKIDRVIQDLSAEV